MRKAQDRGGWPTDEPIDKSGHPIKDWQRRLLALQGVLYRRGSTRTNRYMRRRAQAGVSPEQYESMGYIERQVVTLETLMVDKGVLTTEEIDRKAAELQQR